MAQSDIFSIPLDLCGYSPFVKILFEEKELTMLVDSGACGCLIDRKYIHLPDDMLGGEQILTGLGDTTATGHAVMLFFKVGGELFGCPFTTTEMGNTFQNFPDDLGEIAGIIGGEFLSTYEVLLDYKHGELRIDRQRIKEIVESIKERFSKFIK